MLCWISSCFFGAGQLRGSVLRVETWFGERSGGGGRDGRCAELAIRASTSIYTTYYTYTCLGVESPCLEKIHIALLYSKVTRTKIIPLWFALVVSEYRLPTEGFRCAVHKLMTLQSLLHPHSPPSFVTTQHPHIAIPLTNEPTSQHPIKPNQK